MVKYFLCLILFACGIVHAQKMKVWPVKSKLHENVYSPTFFEEKIVVCSDQKDQIAKNVINENGSETTNLYILDTASGKYERFESFRTALNDGPLTFDEQGSISVVSFNYYLDLPLHRLKDSLNPLALYHADRRGINWMKPYRIDFCKPQYQYTHPALSNDGTTLIFASNMPGGHGGFDLYKSEHVNGKWSEPVNLGDKINSKANEIFPTLNNGLLYYSTDLNESSGLDIYTFDLESQQKERLKNPLNSDKDDFHLVYSSDNKTGFFTSNRNGKDELMAFETELVFPSNCDSLVPNTFCYTLFEENAAEIGEQENLVYQWDINGIKKNGVSIEYCFPGPGDYEITLDIIDTILNKTYYNQSYYYLELRLEEQPFISAPDTVQVNESFTLSASESNLQDVIIEEYHWRLDNQVYKEGLEIQHEFNSESTHMLELMVVGTRNGKDFTDCVYRTIEVTSKQSQLNVDTVSLAVLADTNKVKQHEYFYENQEDSAFVVYSIEVLKSNEDLTDDNIIFKLMEKYGDVKIEFIETDSQYSYLIGEWKKIENAYPTWKKLLEEGYDEAVVRSININEISQFSIDNSFVLDNVTFDYNDWEIKEEAIPDLKNIAEILILFPEIKLRIEAHTDNRGEKESNMELSIQRAKSVKKYLNNKGISNDRLIAKGFGESKPIASNDTEEGQRKNRRVEFTFIKE